MTNERWLRWAIARHFRQKGYGVKMKGVKVGNAIIDGEVVGKNWRMAVEIKSGHDDVIRGLGQLSVALSHGYDSAILVVSLRHARRLISARAFSVRNITVVGVDSKAQIRQISP